jgi:endo-alpha-1,4-polygalactosaminidase (GH114 family)
MRWGWVAVLGIGCTRASESTDGGGESPVADTVTETADTAATTDTGATDTGVTGTGTTDTGVTDTGEPVTVWQPAPGTTWQWQLTGVIDTSLAVDMYDIDLFDVGQGKIDTLHADGRIVICYFSAGSWEEWRADAADFPAETLGNPLEGWPGERWVDIRSTEVRDLMKARMDYAVTRGCDGVEPDNVDGYSNNNGMGLTRTDQLDYNRFLATEAHARNLSVGLKNATGLVSALEPEFDWALNEECVAYQECNSERPFIDAGKAVFHVEYVDRENQAQGLADQMCADPQRRDFSSLVKTWDLDDFRVVCP